MKQILFILIILNFGCQSNSVREPQSIFTNIKNTFFNRPILSQGNYQELKDITIKLLEDCPQNDCIIVGIGRSPTPIMAFIENLLPEKMIQLPLSNFRFNRFSDETLNVARFNEIVEYDKEHLFKLPLEYEQKLYQHFDNFITANNLTGKRIVFTDISNQSLLSVFGYFKNFVEENNIDVKLDVVQITDSYNDQLIEHIQQEYRVKAKRIKMKPNSFSLKFKYSEFDKFAPYERFDLINDQLPVFDNKKKSAYYELKTHLKELQKQDYRLVSDFIFIKDFNVTCTKLIKNFLSR